MRPEFKAMRTHADGFTLAEMAIVLVVVGLLLTGVLSTVSTQVEARNTAETQSRLNQIKDALIGYAQANGRLPCAADGTLATGATGAGLEAVTGNVCTTGAAYVVLPWATLGVSESDVWGRRFRYVVDVNFADAYAAASWSTGCGAGPVPVPASPTSFALCSTGALTVNTRTAANKGGASGTLLADRLPLVIISHGKNGYGAYTSGGTQYTASTTGVDEPANATAAATTFYSREQSPQASTCSDTAAGDFCEFDDLLAYIPANVLISKMVSAGRLP